MCCSCRVTLGMDMKIACVDGPDFGGHQVDFKELLARPKRFKAEETRQRGLRARLHPREEGFRLSLPLRPHVGSTAASRPARHRAIARRVRPSGSDAALRSALGRVCSPQRRRWPGSRDLPLAEELGRRDWPGDPSVEDGTR